MLYNDICRKSNCDVFFRFDSTNTVGEENSYVERRSVVAVCDIDRGFLVDRNNHVVAAGIEDAFSAKNHDS